jgi:hypothetical protein
MDQTTPRSPKIQQSRRLPWVWSRSLRISIMPVVGPAAQRHDSLRGLPTPPARLVHLTLLTATALYLGGCC